jgi:hypothetical protein
LVPWKQHFLQSLLKSVRRMEIETRSFEERAAGMFRSLAPGGSNSALYARRTCACENACVRALVGAWWAGEQLFFAATAACSTYLVRFDTLAAELRSTCHSSKIHDVVFPVPPPPPPPPRTRAGQH